MPDEFDKPLDQEQTDEYGEDAEVPLIPVIAESSSNQNRSEKRARPSGNYVAPTFKWLLESATWLKNCWIGQAFQSASFWTAAATVVIAIATIFYTIYAGLQWKEIHAGSADTHDLAVAAKTQAEKMKSVSEAADKIREAAQNMVTQDERIANNAQRALAASNKQSKDALDATIAQNHLDERPWIGIGQFRVARSTTVWRCISVDTRGRSKRAA